MKATIVSRAEHRLTELDALRGVAALMVVVYHFTSFLKGPAWTTSPIVHWLWPFTAGGNGVALFFVISGFVISMTLERAKKPMDFVVSRFGRLFPAYWSAVCLTSLVRALVPADRVPLHEFLVNLTMTESWFRVPFVDGVYWTLTVELQFYIMMLACSMAGQLGRIEKLCLLWIAFAGMVDLSTRFGVPVQAKEVLKEIFILPHAPLFGSGIMFYRIHRQGPTPLRVGVILFSLAAIWFGSDHVKAIVVTATFALFTMIVTGHLNVIGRNRVLLFLGGISYPLYLIHLSIGVRMIHALSSITANTAVLFVVPLVTILATASAIHRWIEDPARERIRAWYKKGQSRIPVRI